MSTAVSVENRIGHVDVTDETITTVDGAFDVRPQLLRLRGAALLHAIGAVGRRCDTTPRGVKKTLFVCVSDSPAPTAHPAPHGLAHAHRQLVGLAGSISHWNPKSTR